MIYTFGQFELDTDLYELRRAGARCPLEPQVFDVLAYLVENHERVVTKNELIDHIWPERFISEAALTSRLMAARKALGDTGKTQRYISTVRGRGYRFIARVGVTGDESTAGAARAAADMPEPPRGLEEQEIRLCVTPDNVQVAYATSGSGPPFVKAANWLSHLEFDWRSPVWRHWITELSRDHTYIRYDERGCGLSDRDVDGFSLDAWVCDLETVVDALGLERFPLLGISQGGPVAITYAVRHPERVSHLILYGTYALGNIKRAKTPDEVAEHEALNTLIKLWWGRDDPSFRQLFASTFIPGANADQMRWFNDLCRVSASPENAARFRSAFGDIDVAALLQQVSVPTLVLHVNRDQRVPIEEGRALAARIPGARFVPLDGMNHILLEDEPAWPRFLWEIRKFVGVPHAATAPKTQAVHAILFTDVEASTALTRRLGDQEARNLFREHDREIRDLVSLHGGGDVKSMGDGVMASFKSAVRAVECAVAIQRAAERLSEASKIAFRVRVGLHAGEAIAESGDLHGIAVITASRITDHAEGGQILVSAAVRQLTAAKGFRFSGSEEFLPKGFDEPLRIYEVAWRDEPQDDSELHDARRRRVRA